MKPRLPLALIAILSLACSAGCGASSSSPSPTTEDGKSSNDSSAVQVEEGPTSAYPQGLCAVVSVAALASALEISESDVGPCSVIGGDPSPAAGANLNGSGIYELYSLYLSPDEDGYIWSLASSEADFYRLDGRPCFDSLNKGAEGAESASVQCRNASAENVVTFHVSPITSMELPPDVLTRIHAVAEAVFPTAFDYRGGN